MRFAALALLLLSVGMAQAQSAYRWVDQAGKVHYGDRPPPPDTVRELQERRIAAPAADKTMSYALREAAGKFPVTLYVGTNCGAACQDGRDFLGKRGVPFTEKTLSTPEELAELAALLKSAEVVVPVLQVGDKTSKGFLAGNWNALLDTAGYPKAAGR
jgi:hypothetical protein